MPTYRITDPNGRRFDVTAPDDATQEQVLEYAKAQWSKQESAAPKKAPSVEDPGFLKSTLIGAGRTFDKLLDGATQMYLAARGEDSALSGLKKNVDTKAQLYQPLAEARPWATGIGEALPLMAIPAGGSASLLGNMGRMALAGAVPGALEYGSPEERAKRAIVGGAAGASIPMIGAGLRSGWSLLEPLAEKGRAKIVGRTLNRVAGDDAKTVVSRLSSASELVPGSVPTASQVANSGGIAAMERAAAQADPQAYAQRYAEQASARLNALRGIAKDATAMKTAEAARDSATRGLYDQAKSAIVENSPELASTLERLPSNVLATANRLAKLAGEPLKIGQDVPARTAFLGGIQGSIVDEAGKPIAKEVAAETSKYSGRALHYIKLALDDALGKTGDSALGTTEKRLMSGAKDALLEQVDKQIPAYAQARRAYASLSKPINQMQIGQELVNKVQPALADYGAIGSETAATFARALRDADATAARATGFKNATMKSVLSPEQMQAVEAVAKDLARKSTSQNLGRGVGSDTFQKLSMQNIAEQSGMPRVVGGLLGMPGVSRATNWIYRDVDQQMQGLLGEALLNPRMAAELMQNADRKLLESSPRLLQLLQQSAMRGGLLGAPAGYELVSE